LPRTAGYDSIQVAYGTDPNGQSARTDQGDEGRFRRFSRDEIAARGDNLDIAWLRDTSGDPEDALTEPEELVAAIQQHLQNALAEIEALGEELVGGQPEIAWSSPPTAALRMRLGRRRRNPGSFSSRRRTAN
jgi:type I restriction enzyme M protein